MNASEIEQALRWLTEWIAQARVRARGTYPDSYDFASAGIEPANMLAAEDLYALMSAR